MPRRLGYPSYMKPNSTFPIMAFLRFRWLVLQLLLLSKGDTPCLAERVVKCRGDSRSVFLNFSTWSPVNTSLKSSCRCTVVFLSSRHSCIPNGRFTRPPLKWRTSSKAFYDRDRSGPFGLHYQSTPGCSYNRRVGSVGPRREVL